jgi:succinyl-diaminopimelate desuccinylase
VHPVDRPSLLSLVHAHRDDLIAFAQKLVQTQSPSGHEGAAAALVQAEMVRLGYDRAWIDAAGNAVGYLSGGAGPALMFNGHLDHVDAGDPALWAHPPFGGEVHAGALWGRGAADMKGAVAAMVYAGGLLRQGGLPLPGDLYVCGVVQEEVGGLGSRHLARTLPVARAVIGEASANQLRRGHRGRVELVAHLEGRSVHASMPHLGANPHFSISRFVEGLRALPMAADPAYGASTVAPTRTWSEPSGANVTPSALHLVLDWRNVPGESTADIVRALEALLAASLEPGCRGRIEVATKELVSYTGLTMRYADEFPSFTTALDDPALARARAALEAALGRPVEVGTWRFATDGGHLAAAGATVLGFGPGDDALVHTVEERLPLDELVESVVGYLALALL